MDNGKPGFSQENGITASGMADATQIELTADERVRITETSESVEISDTSSVIAFGSDAQKKLSVFTDKALRSAGAADMESAEELIKSLIAELESLSSDNKVGFFGRNKAIQKMREKFQATLDTIETVSRTLEGHRIQLLSDINMCEELYNLSVQNVRELTIYVQAGKQRLITENNRLIKLRENSSNFSEFQSLESGLNRLDKRVHDLDISRISAYQFCAQVSLLRENLLSMSEQIRATLVSVIPIWKSRMMLAMGLSDLAEAANTQRETKELTSRMLNQSEKDIDALSNQIKNSTEIDMATVESLNANLIQTVTKTFEINQKIKAERKEADDTLKNLENDLKNKLGEFL